VAPAVGSTRLPVVRDEWLAFHAEDAIDADLPIIDAHHHLVDRADASRYVLADLLADIASGHNIVATVCVEWQGHAETGVSEVEFANDVAEASVRGGHAHQTRACAGIVSSADLALGDAVESVLIAQIEAGGGPRGRLKGVRFSTATDPHQHAWSPSPRRPDGLLVQPAVRRGFAKVVELGLTFDAYCYHQQLPEVIDLARSFPEARIVLDHVGAPLGLGPYAGRRDQVFADWREHITQLADCPNASVKLGGLGMSLFGFGLHERPIPPSSETLARLWQPYFETCIGLFGAHRAMFESNSPVDKASASYVAIWNAFKRIAAGCSTDEKTALFAGTARDFYGLAT